MSSTATATNWFFVAHNVLHLDDVRDGGVTWWCVDRKCVPGDRAFIYKPLKGVSHYLEIMEITKPETFCSSFRMGTARVKVLNVFEPPITAKQLKGSAVVRNEAFAKRNFQGKAFVINSAQTPNAIVAMGKRT